MYKVLDFIKCFGWYKLNILNFRLLFRLIIVNLFINRRLIIFNKFFCEIFYYKFLIRVKKLIEIIFLC